VADENLFTRNSYGASIFASAPLSEFYRKRRFTQSTRVGLSYQISQTSVKDPEVNQQANSANFIPVIYSQPNILTSRLTPTFVYDTRDYSKSSTDPSGGTQISASLAVAGLLGDVRTYAPTLSYIRFFPVRNKGRDQNPDVFGFRILAAHTGSFGISNAVRNANSLAFIGGIPIYERFFLGDEFTIRGYNVRSITPVAPLDQFITSRNVVLATNRLGTPEAIPGLPSDLANVGLFTGPTGSNSLLLSRQFTSVGGDTQLLANLEYRIPIFGPVSIAAFADVGSAFNLRSADDQSFSSNFLADQPFLGANSLSIFAFQANQTLALSPAGGLVIRDNRLVTREEFNQALRVGPIDPASGLPFGFQQAFLRGEVQTNTVVRLSESVFSKLSDYRSSIGAEIRVQVPVVNVPFRLIYAYNPNARRGFLPELPGVPFNERKSVFRFSVGRTF
jgi:outer membrane protein insertion porin family